MQTILLAVVRMCVRVCGEGVPHCVLMWKTEVSSFICLHITFGDKVSLNLKLLDWLLDKELRKLSCPQLPGLRVGFLHGC